MTGSIITLDGLNAARATLARLHEVGADTRLLLEAAGAIVANSARRRINDTNVGPDGIPWPVSKRAARDGGKTLRDTGKLVKSIRHEVRPGEVEIGVDGGSTSSSKAAALQFGHTGRADVSAHTRKVKTLFGVRVKRGTKLNIRGHSRVQNLPARPFIGVSDQDEADILANWTAQLEDAVR